MARKEEKQKAFIMRQKGMSYSQIKEKLGISKSTLSGWLYNMPLSEERIKELRDFNPIRIEKYRNTMRIKRESKNQIAYDYIAKRIGNISDREFLIAGLFLYWAEGSKTKAFAIGLTNTNPTMLILFIRWLKFFDVPKSKLKVHLHLYSDMNIKKQINFWSKTLDIPVSQFRKPYIKKTTLSSITYTNGFGQGTCSIILENGIVSAKVIMGIKYIQDHLLSA
ncbi:helix-turn-helix domain-containing protein [Candidatus Nomurabacteria bacterium]|nr:helix-turn-helix domain-containing protein [Candidatus Nomurabacteria bacterium]